MRRPILQATRHCNASGPGLTLLSAHLSLTLRLCFAKQQLDAHHASMQSESSRTAMAGQETYVPPHKREGPGDAQQRSLEELEADSAVLELTLVLPGAPAELLESCLFTVVGSDADPEDSEVTTCTMPALKPRGAF